MTTALAVIGIILGTIVYFAVLTKIEETADSFTAVTQGNTYLTWLSVTRRWGLLARLIWKDRRD